MLSEIKKVEKPWGYELIWAHTERYVGKVLHVEKGEKLSLQYHEKKEETIYVQKGVLKFLLEDSDGKIQEHVLNSGQSVHVFPKRKHRMESIETCDLFEVSTPELEDVVRLEDAYGRV